MITHATDVRELVDSGGRHMGQVRIERREGDLLFARFVPGRDFPAVQSLFKQFEEAAEAQALSAVDRIDSAIRALGLKFAAVEGDSPVPVSDVQIWSDGQMSCRLSGDGSPDRNGAPPSVGPRKP